MDGSESPLSVAITRGHERFGGSSRTAASPTPALRPQVSITIYACAHTVYMYTHIPISVHVYIHIHARTRGICNS